MKKLFILISISLLFFTSMNAQDFPQGMKYQAVARDLSGEVLANQEIFLKIHLQSGEDSFQRHYTESHHPTTNQFGLFSITIGEGAVEMGVFSEIPWSTEDIWMKIAIKDKGDTNFKTISNSKLLAVPYAFHAFTANELINERGPGNGVPSQVWSLFGNSNTDPTKDKLGTTDAADLVMITNNIERLRITSDGDVNIVNSLNVGEDLSVEKNVYLNTVSGETVNNGNFTVANMSDTNLTGKLTVEKKTYLKDSLVVDGFGQFNSNINIDASTVTDKLVVTDEASPNPIPRFGSIADVRGLFVADSISILGGLDIGGNLRVHGDSVIVDNHIRVGGTTTLQDILNVSGATTINNTLEVNDQVTINASVTGGDASYDAHPLRVEGSNQGIAIKLNSGTPSNSNNFITFFDNSGGAIGRIEGETAVEAYLTPEAIFANAIFTAEIIAAGVNIGLSLLPNACVGAGAVACPPEPSVVAIAIAEEILAVANAAAYNIFIGINLGVTYQSGSADYAEWLERQNSNEQISAGDIVGVRGGKISKNTSNVEQYLVISTKPAILGNMPMDGRQDFYEKVAFMGQIPVKVRGQVLTGDYILPSGLNDGTGIAISPKLINAEQYSEIVGIAWSSALGRDRISIINMAIGLNANDVAKLAVQLEKQLENLMIDFTSLEMRIAALESGKVYSPPIEVSELNFIEASVPSELDVVQIEEAILLLEETYRDSGIDVANHLGLQKLFNDASFRKEIIEKVAENYKVTYRNIMKMEKQRN